MARPRKMTTAQMLEVVDSYYLLRCERHGKLMKCSLIAQYATELGYAADGYDFRRNTQIREYIDRLKVRTEDNEGHRLAYKTLDVEAFVRNNSTASLKASLSELDAYWKRNYDYAEQIAAKNKKLLTENAAQNTALQELNASLGSLKTENAEVRTENKALTSENRYLRKMLRTYLYPAIADEILRAENELVKTDTKLTPVAASYFIESSLPDSFEVSVSKDYQAQSEAERFIGKLWDKCNE